MSGFFKNWPSEALAQIYSSVTVETDYSICSQYFRVVNINIPDGLEKFIGRVPYHAERVRYWFFGAFFWLISNIFPSLRSKLSEANLTDRKKLSFPERLYAKFECVSIENMDNWIAEFRPEAIYCQVIDRPTAYWWLPFYISQTYHIPLITHMMDDWPTLIFENKSLWNRVVNWPLMNNSLSTLFKQSAYLLGICSSMVTAYQKRYGVHFDVIQHAIDIVDWHMVERPETKRHTTFEILYIGKILPHLQLESLKDISNAVHKLSEKGENVRLLLYGPKFLTGRHSHQIEHPPIVEYKGFIPEEKYPTRLASADLLIIAINFDEHSQRYGRYSMPAKLPEYMASGTAILVYGPPGMPPIDYAKTDGWGFVVNQRDPQLLERSILELMQDKHLREQLGKRARELAFKNHNAVITRQRFESMFMEITSSA